MTVAEGRKSQKEEREYNRYSLYFLDICRSQITIKYSKKSQDERQTMDLNGFHGTIPEKSLSRLMLTKFFFPHHELNLIKMHENKF